MQDKLQELTEKLYKEGLSKGKKEAEDILAKAKNEAAQIVAQAKEQASQIVKQAQKESAELAVKAEGDIKMASVQALASVKQKIESAIQMKSVAQPVSNVLGEKEFFQSVIKTVAQAFNPAQSSRPLELILPESLKAQTDSFVKEQLVKSFGNGIEISYDRNIKNGFKVSRKGDGYFIDFSDGSFEKIIGEYLRPKTRKLLFGE